MAAGLRLRNSTSHSDAAVTSIRVLLLFLFHRYLMEFRSAHRVIPCNVCKTYENSMKIKMIIWEIFVGARRYLAYNIYFFIRRLLLEPPLKKN